MLHFVVVCFVVAAAAGWGGAMELASGVANVASLAFAFFVFVTLATYAVALLKPR